MTIQKVNHDDRESQFSAQGQWASTLAWGFAAAAALAAFLLWVLFGS